MWCTTVLCLMVFVAGVHSACRDYVPQCDMLDAQYCEGIYRDLAMEVCAKRCNLCEENSSLNKRSHNHGPDWLDHCWDDGANHVKDPFCALLTTTTTTTTTTPKPTTTPTTTTTEATTTTTEATTTTTEPPTTTTTEPTTTTTEPPEVTFLKSGECYYIEYNDTDIKSTDFATDQTLIENNNVTINETVHLKSDIPTCQAVCAQSVLNAGFECWAFTYNEETKCSLYYYNRRLYIDETIELEANNTTLFLKRCTDDKTTEPPKTTQTTMEPVRTTMAPVQTTMAPVVTSGAPAVATTAAAGPNTHNVPSGVQIISTTSYKITGLPSPFPDTCFFMNTTYKMGEHWKERCEYDCECTDTNLNEALCSYVCPRFTSRPANCRIVRVAGQCCPSLDCDNSTDTNSTMTGGNGGNATCGDTLDTCDWYEDSACVGLYEPWARAHCALRCGYCPQKEECIDRITFCSLYELDTACGAYKGWARHNCKASCNICTN